MKNENKSTGINLMSTLFLIFLVLKLTGLVKWNWWIVFSPIYGGFLLIFLIIGIYIVFISDK